MTHERDRLVITLLDQRVDFADEISDNGFDSVVTTHRAFGISKLGRVNVDGRHELADSLA
jgi:hypothetical protein